MSVHRLAKNTKFETPYYKFAGDSAGQTVIVTAGIHGNERASIRAAQQLLAHLQNRMIRIDNGTLIVVPIVHRIAYKRRIRGVPDLNRAFPRAPGQSARHPLAAALFRMAKKARPAWYIDLHEANGLSRVNPRVLGQTLIVNPRGKAISPARRIAAQINRTIASRRKRFTVRVKPLSGSGRQAAFRLLKSRAITVETSWSLPFSARVRYQTNIIRHILEEARLINVP